MEKKNIIILCAVVSVVAALGAQMQTQKAKLEAINNFDECVAAGYPIMESYPERCMTSDKRTFVKTVIQSQRFTGTMVCLPHKNTDGPQTLECAFGLETDDKIYYGLKNIPTEKMVGLETGKRIIVKGKLVEDNESIYNIEGNIEVESMEQEFTSL